ncbi:hypothetical protein R1flu_012536 [Riccia fluitans]|uniref:UDP N-acetylglucosamine O-acyltransferase C-terminal domain-containing protein n=1 Tax=Riccia fluitans TaxID=41844 RepID=A0ABD1ZC13_9MARC
MARIWVHTLQTQNSVACVIPFAGRVLAGSGRYASRSISPLAQPAHPPWIELSSEFVSRYSTYSRGVVTLGSRCLRKRYQILNLLSLPRTQSARNSVISQASPGRVEAGGSVAISRKNPYYYMVLSRIPKRIHMHYLPGPYCNYYSGLNKLQKTATSAGSPVHPPSATTDSRIIHSSAVVHPDSIIGEGVEIGAFCTVGPKVKLGNGCILHPGSHVFGDTLLGENCVLFTGAVVGADIPGKVVIGNNNLIGYHAVVGVKCQDMKYKEGDECTLYIGENNDIREFVSIHRSSKPDDETRVGNDNLIMGSCHIAHDCKIGNRNIFANGTLLGGHVTVEDLVHTGGAVAVHQFSHIGSYSFLAGGSMVDRDVPMFMMVAGDRAKLRGLNLEGMRRCGFSDVEVRSIRKVYQRLFMKSDASIGIEEKLSELEQLDEFRAVPAVSMMLQSIRNCFGEHRRGLCSFRHWSSV